ncbi:hypothetical protein [Neisseria zoodegmatis]|uniref:hypothetical protein n=1 Tax=Neisseria zoodegmatis TaxID=326523 RepID=UPI00117E5E59|nr:hypothetical protein [Neisseria zoodegmatis]
MLGEWLVKLFYVVFAGVQACCAFVLHLRMDYQTALPIERRHTLSFDGLVAGGAKVSDCMLSL